MQKNSYIQLKYRTLEKLKEVRCKIKNRNKNSLKWYTYIPSNGDILILIVQYNIIGTLDWECMMMCKKWKGN